MAAHIASFTGSNMLLEPHLLESGEAQRAHNVQYERGSARSFREPLPAGTLPAGSVSIYPVDGQWMAWGSDAVSVDAGPAIQDTRRIYYTGDGYPKMRLASAGSTVYRLGLPAPGASPTASVSGDPTDMAAPAESMAFVYTYVTALDEEGPPSVPTGIVTARPGQSVTVGASISVPTDGYSITQINVYKTSSLDVPEPEYQYLGSLEPSETTYTFTLGQETLGRVLHTKNWDRPPEDAQGMISIGNGMMAAFVDRDVLISEPFQPHAWPIDYRFQTEYEIVGLAPIRGGFVIGTKGTPYVVSASSPASARMEKIDRPLACMSRRGMVEISGVVIYPSPDGLVMVGPGLSPRNITEGIIPVDTWRSMNPETLHAYSWNGRYVAFFTGDDGPGGFIIDPNGSGFSLLDMYAVGGYSDPQDGELYLVIQDEVMRWDRGLERLPYSVKTKLFRYPSRTAITALRVDAESYPVRVALYGDGRCMDVVTVCNDRPHRVRGTRARRWEALVMGKNTVYELSFGRSSGDLA